LERRKFHDGLQTECGPLELQASAELLTPQAFEQHIPRREPAGFNTEFRETYHAVVGRRPPSFSRESPTVAAGAGPGLWAALARAQSLEGQPPAAAPPAATAADAALPPLSRQGSGGGPRAATRGAPDVAALPSGGAARAGAQRWRASAAAVVQSCDDVRSGTLTPAVEAMLRGRVVSADGSRAEVCVNDQHCFALRNLKLKSFLFGTGCSRVFGTLMPRGAPWLLVSPVANLLPVNKPLPV
jgi:hypothetical protein